MGARRGIGVLACLLATAALAEPRFRVPPHVTLVEGKSVVLAWSYREGTAPGPALVEISRDGNTERIPATDGGSLHYITIPYKCGKHGDFSYWLPGMEKTRAVAALPCPGKSLVKLAFVTDTHSDKTGVMGRQIAAKITARPIQAVLHGGDLVDHADDPLEWRQFWQSMSPLLGTKLLLPTVGNHDYGRMFRNRPWRAQMGDIKPERGFYRVKTGALQLIVLNSNFDQDETLADAQLPWLEHWLADPAIWNVVMFHHPPFSTSKVKPKGGFKEDSLPVRVARERLVPIFEKHGVDLVLNGDTHIFQLIKKDCVNYLVGGPAGGVVKTDTSRFVANPLASITEPVSTVTFLEVGPNALTAATETADGRALSELRLEK